MASEHEKLVEEVAREIGAECPMHHDMPDLTMRQCEALARAAIAFIAKRTKEAPKMPADAKRWTYDRDGWALLHAASALWPSHGMDGKEGTGQ